MNYANRYGYSDVYPYEVVRKVSEKTLEIRAMDYVIDPEWQKNMKMHPGGFAAHCENQSEQKWIYSSNPKNGIFRIRLGKKGWRCANGNSYQLSNEPRHFHDYNF